MLDLLAQLPQATFDRPPIDWHALAPELVLLGFGVLVTLVDIVFLERGRAMVSALAGVGLLATVVPLLTLWNEVDTASPRVLFDGAYVVDRYSLVMKIVFVLVGYVVILLSTNYIAEGDYWESEYYGLLLSSIMGMVVMASARDLISIFVALELLSIPAYLLAAWRKRDPRGNEAGIKYYLMGVFASAVMLYGMSLLYGVTGSTLLTDIAVAVADAPQFDAAIALGIVFVVVGFAFKISAVPFHHWAPDTYEGAPTPVAGFLAVASKAAGFVALMNLVFVAFPDRHDVYQPLIWVMAVLSMTVGNLLALRQTNMVRLLAYSGVAQTGFMLAPLTVAGDPGVSDLALSTTVNYLAIYAAMNLGAFAVVIALARKTGSAEIDDLKGAFQYAPGLTVAMTVFLFSLAGIPPIGGWFAKFNVFRSLAGAETTWAYILAVIVAVNSVIALYYYASVARKMWADEAPDGNLAPVHVPPSLVAALAITVAVTLVFGFFPGTVGDFTDVSLLASP
ncbi:MAG: NADH-quinone oxidoreductase subunit N [Acidimicrobiia bacterium]|nr:NADH-quinone oxidoreductase subunit N [Acidimicrobiia bacterium]